MCFKIHKKDTIYKFIPFKMECFSSRVQCVLDVASLLGVLWH
jgi:hypothetical protein